MKMANFQKSKNKFKYVSLLTPRGIAEKVALTSRFLNRKMEKRPGDGVALEVGSNTLSVITVGVTSDFYDLRPTRAAGRVVKWPTFKVAG